MMKAVFAAAVWAVWTMAAQAQDAVWIQVEAQPTLRAAQDRARAYDVGLDDVAGYYLGSGWYGVVLGPYGPADAEALLRRLRAEGRVPSDSFIALGGNFSQQFWPVGVAAPTAPQPLPGAEPAPDQADTPAADAPVIAVPDETPQQARAAESLLTRPEREELQRMLQWAGFYDAAIDGAFGRGTRSAMEAWQIANNHAATGVLTTGQRAELTAAYNAVLEGLDLTLTRDEEAGIEILVPAGIMAFDRYEPPFAHYEPTGDTTARLVLISQPGDRTRMNGLYEILQTLDVVPPEGERSRDASGFTINGANGRVQSFTRVTLDNDRIKGFLLVWPAGDDERFSRVRAAIDASFRRTGGVLDPAVAPPDEDQAVDLVAGLAIRKPRLTRSGFYIGRDGTVMTTSDAVAECDRISIDGDNDVAVAHRDETRGVAVLRPSEPLAPMGVAAFQTAVPRLQSEVAVAGFPYGDVLAMPALTFGRLADLRGLNGEEGLRRLALVSQDGDAGGPVFDSGGAVVGMLLPKAPLNGQRLPDEVSFAVGTPELLDTLDDAGFAPFTTDMPAFMPPETLTLRAADTTVLVSCW